MRNVVVVIILYCVSCQQFDNINKFLRLSSVIVGVTRILLTLGSESRPAATSLYLEFMLKYIMILSYFYTFHALQIQSKIGNDSVKVKVNYDNNVT